MKRVSVDRMSDIFHQAAMIRYRIRKHREICLYSTADHVIENQREINSMKKRFIGECRDLGLKNFFSLIHVEG